MIDCQENLLYSSKGGLAITVTNSYIGPWLPTFLLVKKIPDNILQKKFKYCNVVDDWYHRGLHN